MLEKSLIPLDTALNHRTMSQQRPTTIKEDLPSSRDYADRGAAAEARQISLYPFPQLRPLVSLTPNHWGR